MRGRAVGLLQLGAEHAVVRDGDVARGLVPAAREQPQQLVGRVVGGLVGRAAAQRFVGGVKLAS